MEEFTGVDFDRTCMDEEVNLRFICIQPDMLETPQRMVFFDALQGLSCSAGFSLKDKQQVALVREYSSAIRPAQALHSQHVLLLLAAHLIPWQLHRATPCVWA